MKTTPQLESNLLTDPQPLNPAAPRTRATDFAYQPERGATPPTVAAAAVKKLPELTNFRAISRSVFGAESGREYIKEAIVFAAMMVVAAWPLSVTLNELGTMMISPPNALW